MTHLEFALSLLERNISVIPMAGKRPAVSWSEFQKRLATRDEVCTWLKGQSNIGIVTGAISSLVVVDIDSKEALSWAEAKLPSTPMKTKTSSGEHWYFRYPKDIDKVKTFAKLKKDGRVLDIDIRADGGCIVAPHSQHPNGCIYEEITPWGEINIKDLPEFCPDWFLKETKTSLQKSDSLNEKILSDLFENGQAVEGHGGDTHTYQAACHLVRDLGLSTAEALPYLQEWNKFNSPPWNESDLRKKLEHALKYGTGDIKKTSRLVLTSAKDLVAEPPEEFDWLWEDRLISVGTSIFVSKPKIGKTTLARSLAVSIASGRAFLGMRTKGSPVVYIAAEENREQFKKALSHFDPEELKDLYVHTGHTPPDLVPCLEQYTHAIKPGLIILDTMIRAINVADTNSYAEMTKALAPFQNFATQNQCHVMFVHHAGKVDRDHGDGVLGSTAIFGSVDTLLMLEKKKNEIFIRTIQRYGESLEPHLLQYNKETREHSMGDSSQQIAKASYEDRVLQFLEQHPNSLESAIHAGVEGHKGAIGATLRRLTAEGRILRSGDGRRGAPFVYSLLF